MTRFEVGGGPVEFEARPGQRVRTALRESGHREVAGEPWEPVLTMRFEVLGRPVEFEVRPGRLRTCPRVSDRREVAEGLREGAL
ncbi:hypothetical protein OHA40_13065 [Nocardia sp. NBC_00508]|uniref:hypothetical protein n=1 Tax=Nocardia sp. NBC_00508 TaxID=2975992 RepID=UPI002E810D98|nr:hypothetical protein [Nocardia sp. NBC_00508]WUD68961.1 hypothetical protein OHA40_13065 [Nocardia sp. NBC_00508]